MADQIEILGIFDDCGQAAAGARAVRDDGLGEVLAYSPVPDHALAQAFDDSPSPVRLFVLIGGLLGCVTGFAFPIYTVMEWPMITGGKPLISIPAFVVIAFELTILFASIGGMIGFLAMSGLPSLRGHGHDPHFTDDTSGIRVTCAADQAAAVRACLERTGATEIRE